MGSETKKCASFTIIDDKTVEMMEPFEFIITFLPGQEAINGGEIVPAAMQLTGIINIIDDDGELNWNEAINAQEILKPSHQFWDTYNALDVWSFHFFYSEITVQFAQDMYMVRESDGMVDVMVVASEKTPFSYMFTVTPTDITATSTMHDSCLDLGTVIVFLLNWMNPSFFCFLL